VPPEFREQGYELSLVELEALASTDARALRALGEGLDRRIRKLVSEANPHEE
jgi:hypothetical protein